jgi:hypothetical protein
MGPVFPGKLFPEKSTTNMIPYIQIEDIVLSRQIVAESDAFSAARPFQNKEGLMRKKIQHHSIQRSFDGSQLWFYASERSRIIPSGH